jgi:hypothetical protein
VNFLIFERLLVEQEFLSGSEKIPADALQEILKNF